MGFLAGIILASSWKSSRAFAVLNSEKEEETQRAANHLFYSSRIRSTEMQTGILIYISLFERKIIIRADDGILKTIPESEWNEMITSIIPQLKTGDIKSALESILDQIEPELVESFPISADDQNERSNELLLFHPRP